MKIKVITEKILDVPKGTKIITNEDISMTDFNCEVGWIEMRKDELQKIIKMFK